MATRVIDQRTPPRTPIGCVLARRLTSALVGLGIPYARVTDLVYSECRKIASEAGTGDWLEFPDGTTFILSFKPNGQTPRR